MKTMWDEKILIKLIKDEAEIPIDDTLSDTSENPVQNKVIYNALENKQDSLPSTSGQTGKFLKVGSDGLEWGSAGGNKYLHCISYRYYQSSENMFITAFIELVTDSATPLNKDNLGIAIREAGYDAYNNALSCVGYGSGVFENAGKINYKFLFIKKCWCASSNSLVGYADITTNALDITQQTSTLTKNENATYTWSLASAEVLDSVFPL